jgi:NAD-dependent SIR2 family protein deacetylase
MSMSSVEVVCKKCGSTIYRMRILKSIRDILRQSNGRCNVCGTMLNPGDFIVSVEKRNT